MVTIDGLSAGMASLLSRIRELWCTERESIRMWMDYYKAQIEIEKLRTLKNISDQLTRIGNIQEGA